MDKVAVTGGPLSNKNILDLVCQLLQIYNQFLLFFWIITSPFYFLEIWRLKRKTWTGSTLRQPYHNINVVCSLSYFKFSSLSQPEVYMVATVTPRNGGAS